MKFAPMAIPAMALLQQHDGRRDILIEPAARRCAAIEARGHSELGAQKPSFDLKPNLRLKFKRQKFTHSLLPRTLQVGRRYFAGQGDDERQPTRLWRVLYLLTDTFQCPCRHTVATKLEPT